MGNLPLCVIAGMQDGKAGERTIWGNLWHRDWSCYVVCGEVSVRSGG